MQQPCPRLGFYCHNRRIIMCKSEQWNSATRRQRDSRVKTATWRVDSLSNGCQMMLLFTKQHPPVWTVWSQQPKSILSNHVDFDWCRKCPSTSATINLHAPFFVELAQLIFDYPFNRTSELCFLMFLSINVGANLFRKSQGMPTPRS